MKKFVDLLTDDQIEELKTCYLITDENGLYKVTRDNGEELTEENFKVLVKGEEGFLIATIENIFFCDPEEEDFDFKVMCDSECLDYFERESTPENVVEFLDKVLNKAQYEKKE